MKQSYSNEDKALALNLLQANSGNISETARDSEAPASTIRDWREGRSITPEIEKIREEKKEQLADLFERVSRKYLAQAERDEVISSTKGKDSVTAAAIAADKMQLLRGNATSITHNLTEEEKKAELERLYEDQREEDRKNAEKLIG